MCQIMDRIGVATRQEEYSEHDFLPAIIPGEVRRARSTSVYCLCGLQDTMGRRNGGSF